MKTLIVLVIVLVCSVTYNESKDLVVGTRVNNLLVSTEKFIFRSIPLIRRDKDYTYRDPKQRVIKGIIARDLSRTGTEVTVTDGGVGSTHVSLHFKSDRGGEINYLILIFTKNT